IRFTKTYTRNIEFQIPEGYTVEGLSQINKSVDNETGSFTLSAKEENGTVQINISKVYKEKKIEKEKWNELLDVLDAAYNNTFKYILLIPKKESTRHEKNHFCYFSFVYYLPSFCTI